jgi:hypothetical protein
LAVQEIHGMDAVNPSRRTAPSREQHQL